jgi:glycosyltransferase involved in cell wall biosynthesis
MRVNVSVVLTIRNVEKYISRCLTSLLNQTVKDFEIIIVDDISSDRTREIIEKFSDNRIRYIRNTKWLGLSHSRNKCLEYAHGDYIFFTDGDCAVSENWIEEGLKYLKIGGYIGVEGKTYYVSKEYEPTRSDDVVENKTGGLFMTCNIVYSKKVLKSINGFDERFTFHEDLDLALRALRQGKILFNPQMIVYHQKKIYTPKRFVKNGQILRNRVLLYKKFKDKSFLFWRIANPKDLVSIIFPIFTFTSFFRNVYKSKDDFNLFPFIYVRLVYERLEFWDMCVRERVFLI